MKDENLVSILSRLGPVSNAYGTFVRAHSTNFTIKNPHSSANQLKPINLQETTWYEALVEKN